MPFIELGKIEVSELPQDPEFIFPDNGGTLHVTKSSNFISELYILCNNRKYEFNVWAGCDKNCKIIPVGSEMWILKSDDYCPIIIYTVNGKLAVKVLSTFFHVVETGVYYWGFKSVLRFFNFQTKESSKLSLNVYDVVYFYKNYIFLSENKTIYINTENLPQDLDFNLLLQKPDSRIFPERQVKVNFKDTVIIFPVSDLLIFKSVFINDQLEDQDEIFLDIEYCEFNVQNMSTVIYLISANAYHTLLLLKFSLVN